MNTKRLYATAATVLLGAGSTNAVAQNPLVLERAVVRDPMASSANQDAVHLFIPKGWKVDGGIVWYPHHLHQANLECRIRNPQGPEQIETFPFKAHHWRQNWIVQFPQGSNYLGSEVQPPCPDPKEYVRYFVLPRHRRGATIVGYQELPEVAKGLGASGNNVTIRAGRTRIEYSLNHQAMEEDIYVVVVVYTMNDGTGMVWSWSPDRVFGLRAAKGELDKKSPTLLAVANSVQVKPGWFGEFTCVKKLFEARVYQGISAAKALSDRIAANSDEIRRMLSDSYREQQASQDRIHARFSEYIRGVTTYHNPNERYPVQLPSGYNQVWAGANGQYILSNNANFNPNVGSTTNWTQLQQVR